MEPTRIGLLALGAAALTSTAMLVATRRAAPTAHGTSPLGGPAEQARIDPANLAALVDSIERLIQTLERAPPKRLEAAAAGPPRRAVAATDDTTVVELLREQNALLAEVHAALLKGARGGAEPAQRVRELRDAVGAGPRPTNGQAWADFFARHPPASINEMPVELAVLGVADVLERFGWPQQTIPPSTNNGNWSLVYRDLEINTPDGVVTAVGLNCNRDGTYFLDVDRR